MIVLLLLCLPAGTLAQQAGPANPSSEPAADRVTQARQAVHLMDQDIARALSGGGKTRDSAPRSTRLQEQQQSAHRAHLEQRTTFLAVVRAAELRLSLTPKQVAAREELEQRYRRVPAVFR